MATNDGRKLPAAKWFSFFQRAGVRADELNEQTSEHRRSVVIGQFLSPKVGREVPVLIDGRAGKAVLRASMARAKSKLYHFEVRWDDSPPRRVKDGPKGKAKKKRRQADGPTTASDPGRKRSRTSDGTSASGNDEQW